MFSKNQLVEKTLIELKEIEKNLGIPGMSKQRKNIIVNQIVAKCRTSGSLFTQSDLEEKTKDELKGILKNLGGTGYSKQTKDALVDNILETSSSTSTITKESGPIKAISFQIDSKRIDGGIDSKATVSCGANSGNWNVVGKTVGQVSSILREAINIPTNSQAVVNSEKVDDSYVIKKGDTVEYMKVAGRKG